MVKLLYWNHVKNRNILYFKFSLIMDLINMNMQSKFRLVRSDRFLNLISSAFFKLREYLFFPYLKFLIIFVSNPCYEEVLVSKLLI
jgi:hypothetical protein